MGQFKVKQFKVEQFKVKQLKVEQLKVKQLKVEQLKVKQLKVEQYKQLEVHSRVGELHVCVDSPASEGLTLAAFRTRDGRQRRPRRLPADGLTEPGRVRLRLHLASPERAAGS